MITVESLSDFDGKTMGFSWNATNNTLSLVGRRYELLLSLRSLSAATNNTLPLARRQPPRDLSLFLVGRRYELLLSSVRWQPPRIALSLSLVGHRHGISLSLLHVGRRHEILSSFPVRWQPPRSRSLPRQSAAATDPLCGQPPGYITNHVYSSFPCRCLSISPIDNAIVRTNKKGSAAGRNCTTSV